jgi:hypothetical protein
VAKRSDFKRRKHDAYQTIDARAVRLLKPHLRGVRTFAEPCVGAGYLVADLQRLGLECTYRDDVVNDGVDALTLTAADLNGTDAIITNPPWTRALLHPLILHFQKLKPTWLLFDADWAYNRAAVLYLDQCSDIVAVGRLRWIEGTTNTGKDNASWYRFWHRHSGGPRFHNRRT